jgi:hypothetical protein
MAVPVENCIEYKSLEAIGRQIMQQSTLELKSISNQNSWISSQEFMLQNCLRSVPAEKDRLKSYIQKGYIIKVD